LGLISSVVSKTGTQANDVGEFKKVLGGRIEAIAIAQNHLTKRNWRRAPLKLLIETEVAAYVANSKQKLSMTGPDIEISPKAYTSLTLVIHELTTNAVKYGALKQELGELVISWHKNENDELVIEWEENNVEATPPTQKGFGSIIINRSIPYDLGGRSDVEFRSFGLKVTLTITQKFVY